MVDVWRTMEPNIRLATWVFVAVFFSLACLAPGKWTPLSGLVALHVPMAVTLVSERSFARLYLLTGFTTAFAIVQSAIYPSVAVVAAAALLLFITLAYESFFFKVAALPVSTKVNAFLPLGLALGRFVLFGGIAGVLWYLLPSPRPFLVTQPRIISDEVRARPTMTPDQFNAHLFKAFLYTMGMVLLLLGLLALLRYLHSKLKRTKGELLPESIGIPMSSPMRMAREKKRRRERGDDPLMQMVKDYERFSSAPKSELARRRPSQTPQEFATKLRNVAALPSAIVGQITDAFTGARYAEQPVTWETAEEFSNLVDQALKLEDEQED
jgi:hypothetical protein